MAAKGLMGVNKKLPLKAVLFMIAFTLLSAAAQFLLKVGMAKFDFTIVSIITNSHLLAGILLYACAAFPLLFSLKHAELSSIYPFMSLSYIWVLILSIFILNEQVIMIELIGITFIIFGVSLVAGGANSA